VPYETDFDAAFTILLGKAQGTITQTGTPSTGTSGGGGGTTTPTTPTARPASIDFEWSGGGQQLDISRSDALMAEVPFPANIVWVHVYAFDGHGEPVPVQAVIETRITKFSSFGGSPTPLYGSGVRPSLSTASANNVNLSGWVTNLDAGDTIIAYPQIYIGTAIGLAMTIQLRPVDATVGVDPVLDSGGNAVLTSTGEAMVYRT
jgi:hypothetical protein